LCATAGVRLLRSHIVPKAAYRRPLDPADGEPKASQPVKVTPKTSVSTNEQMTEYLLCAACEERFSSRERIAFPLFSHGDKSFPWLDGVRTVQAGLADSSALDTESLALFSTSIFWRLSVSKHSSMDLGPYEPAFRSYLFGQGPFPDKAALAIVLLDHKDATIGRVDRSFNHFKSTRDSRFHYHRFNILGVDMQLRVGKLVPSALKEICFVRTKLVMVVPSDEFARSIGRTLAMSVPKGKLAAGNPWAVEHERGRSLRGQ
jgi:hypothetical protein